MNVDLATFWKRVDEHATAKYLIPACIVIAVLAIAAITMSLAPGSKELKKDAYSSVLVDMQDIPAPPFIGWSRDDMTEPQPASHFVNYEWSNEQCREDSPAYGQLDPMINDATGWSGRSFYNTGYEAELTVQLSNSSQGSIAGINQLADNCRYVTATDDGAKIEGGVSAMDVDMRKFDFDAGGEWITTASAYVADRPAGHKSTITAIGRREGITLQMSLTVNGNVDDNAIRNLELVWRSQSAKLTAMKDDIAAINAEL